MGDDTEHTALRSPVEVGDSHAGGGLRESLQVAHVTRRDHGATSKVSVRHEECIHGELRSSADAPEKLSRPHAGSTIHRVDFNALPPQASEDAGVLWSTPYHFSEHCGDRRDRKTA